MTPNSISIDLIFFNFQKYSITSCERLSKIDEETTHKWSQLVQTTTSAYIKILVVISILQYFLYFLYPQAEGTDILHRLKDID